MSKIAGKGQLKFMVAGLGWATAELLMTRSVINAVVDTSKIAVIIIRFKKMIKDFYSLYFCFCVFIFNNRTVQDGLFYAL